MQPTVEYPSGMCLWAAPEDATAIDEAKAYIKAEGYSSETVRLVKSEGQVRVMKK